MKKLLPLLISIFLFPSTTHSQNITDEGNEWKIAYYNWMQGWITSPYYLEGDTVINGKNYKKIFTDIDNPDQSLVYLIREDSTKKVYSLFANTEALIYDFGAEVGDTIKSSFVDTMFAIVESVDSVTLTDGTKRKRQKIVPLNFLNILGDEYWIEGIGGSLIAFKDISTFSAADADTRLNCFSNNSQIIYGPLLANECDLVLPTEDLLDASFSISPNPVWDVFFIKNESAESYSIQYELIDQQGITILKNEKEISQNQSIEVKTDHLPSGIYFLNIKHNTTFTVKKILIQK